MSNAQHIARVGALVPPRHGQPGRPPLLVMVAGYSRVTAAVILPSGHSPDLFAGPWELLRRWGSGASSALVGHRICGR